MKRQGFTWLLCFCIAGIVSHQTAAEEKIICAFRAATPPVLDGSLDEPCWQGTEVRDDFMPLYSLKLERTAMRFLYDDTNLYLGLEVFTAEPKPIHDIIREIQAKPGFKEGFCSINDFINQGSVEIFLDPGASMRNHYQILFNAAGQICGHYKYDWETAFPEKPVGKAMLTPQGWSAEIVLSRAALNNVALNPGDTWGFDLARNDLIPVAIWKETGIAFNTPSQFGRLTIGDYRTWWEQQWDSKIVGTVQTLEKETAGRPEQVTFLALKDDVTRKLAEMKPVTAASLTSRPLFLAAYEQYVAFYPVFHRFEAAATTRRAMLAADAATGGQAKQ